MLSDSSWAGPRVTSQSESSWRQEHAPYTKVFIIIVIIVFIFCLITSLSDSYHTFLPYVHQLDIVIADKLLVNRRIFHFNVKLLCHDLYRDKRYTIKDIIKKFFFLTQFNSEFLSYFIITF